jgi:hypothetical protein
MNFKKTILLTGAGFTANFGGILAKEMWSKILNNQRLDQLPEIKKILMGNFDFESVYSEIINGEKFSDDEKTAFQKIISESYGAMDETLKQFIHSGYNQYGIDWRGVSEFLGMFAGSQTEPGVHFTLNQDLLLERSVKIHPLGMAAAQTQYREYWDSISLGQLDPSKQIVLPNDSGVAEFIEKNLPSVGGMYYIKLHGSQGWLSSTGKAQLVIGANKLEDIQKEPLLAWYFKIFEEALSRKDVSLFVIGYSFRDEHINKLLIDAIQKYGLKLIIISPEDPESFKSRMEGNHEKSGGVWQKSDNHIIWESIRGYFPYKLNTIFPEQSGQIETQIFKDIKKFIV